MVSAERPAFASDIFKGPVSFSVFMATKQSNSINLTSKSIIGEAHENT